MRRKGLLVLLSSFIVSIGTFAGYGVQRVNAETDETTLLPKGWKYETLDETGSSRIDTPYLTVKAYKDSQRGNSLELVRQVSAYKLYATSDYFVVSKNNSYKVELFGRSECLDDDGNVLTVSVLEKKTDGSVVSAEIGSLSGRQSFWTSISGYYSVSSDCEGIAIQVAASGFGNFFVNDVTVRSVPSTLMSLSNYGIELKEDGTELESLATNFLSDDAASGEKSLHLNNKGIKMKLGQLPNGVYELRMDYKHSGGKGTRGSIRLDNLNMAGVRAWYAVDVPEASTNEGWATYSYQFKKDDTVDISWMQIFFYGEYYIDNLAIYDEEGYNYIPDGSFEGYDMPGVSFEGNVGLVQNKDGSLMYAGCYETFHSKADPVLIYDASTLSLEDGKTYTLSYEYRNGWGTGFGSAKLGDTVLIDGCEASETWIEKAVSFTGAKNKPLRISFGSGWGGRLGYIKNISIESQEGTECIKVSPKQFVTNPDQIGDNVFENGDFAYDFSEMPSSDSSSSFGDYFPGESSSEPSIPSIWEPSSSSLNSKSEEDIKEDAGGSSSSNVIMVTVASILIVVATGGLVASAIFLARGKKKDE